MTRATGLASVVLVLSGCHPHPPPPDLPALLTNPGGRVHAELVAAVRRALNGTPVTIADGALTTDEVLIVERTARRDGQGRDLDGRDKGLPERFRLVMRGSSCVLVHERTGRCWTLNSATCAPRARRTRD